MTVKKENYSSYYEIRDAWGGAVYLTKENLQELRKEIDKLLAQAKED